MAAHNAILDAFGTCILRKPLDAISVGDICEIAGVSKKTYYNHFQSRQELISALINRDFFDPQRQIRQSLFSSQLSDGVKMLLQLTYETLFQKQDLYLKLIDSLGKATFSSMFAELSQEMNLEVYKPNRELSEDEQTELDYFCMFLSTTSAQSLIWWAERGFQPSSDKMAGLYYRWSIAQLEDGKTPFPEMCASTARV